MHWATGELSTNRTDHTMRAFALILLAASVAWVAPAQAQSTGAKFVEKNKNWSVFEHSGADGKLCFAVSKPTDFEPKQMQRDDIYFYVSTWPKDGVRDEISIKAGYAYAENSTTTVTIGSEVFELFNNGDKSFVESPAQERQLVQAMRRGSRMTVKGRSKEGTETVDVYSLSGVTASLREVEQNCRS